jgi:cyclic pyranopterin phosphate synthase
MLTDPFGRQIEYVRLSVTDRCDLRCTYCMPEGFKDFEEPAHWLSFNEMERMVGAFARLGVKRFRLTGGEPLLRRNLPELAARLAALPGVEDLSLSTNATQLAKHAHDLKNAGVTRLNVSLDSLQKERIEKINGRDVFDKIMAGLYAAKDAGFQKIKLNMVAIAGQNDDEIDAMVEFAMAGDYILRLIETMPMGDTGRASGFLDLQPVKARLAAKYGLIETVCAGGGPARYLGTPDGQFSIGFITPLSQHFCETCNRVRVSVDGTMYLCLGQDDNVALGPLLKSGAGYNEIEQAILQAVTRKPERHEFRETPQKLMRFMSMTGG